MKREIKFRVWNGMEMVYDITSGKFGTFYVNPENGDGLNPKDTASLTVNTTKYHENTPIMQFSGEKDKNGIDIYESDILLFDDGQKAEVKWQQAGLIVEADFGDYEVTTVGWAIEQLGDCEVIGNIFQNPSLLE